MERLRRQHNAQWYHETQSSVRGDTPLEPQAATLRDRFLLGLGAFADEALNSALGARAGVFNASLAGYHALFPDQVSLSRYVTLSPYDRLSTALTVAQVTGVQSLCSHYAARLAPLHSPDASRESNIRLAQITQYARQLASQPTLICRKALQQLVDVGLSPADIVTFSQIIGFVSYQARVVAGIAALAGRPAVVVPGFPNVEDADGVAFSTEELSWTARLSPIDTETAAAEQLDVLDLYCGQTVESAQCEELLAAPHHPYTQALIRAMPDFGRSLPHKSRLNTLPGAIPSLEHLPIGCRLGPRCPYAQKKCIETPRLRPVKNHFFACHFPLNMEEQ